MPEPKDGNRGNRRKKRNKQRETPRNTAKNNLENPPFLWYTIEGINRLLPADQRKQRRFFRMLSFEVKIGLIPIRRESGRGS